MKSSEDQCLSSIFNEKKRIGIIIKVPIHKSNNCTKNIDEVIFNYNKA